jgi:hypothetical protein
MSHDFLMQEIMQAYALAVPSVYPPCKFENTRPIFTKFGVNVLPFEAIPTKHFLSS